MRTRLWLALLAVIATPVAMTPQEKDASAAVAAGIAQVNGGDLSGGLFALDSALRQLSADMSRHTRELSLGYLYRGIALAGLDQEESAKASFAAALRHDPSLKASEGDFAPKILRLIDAARHDKTRAVVLETPNTNRGVEESISREINLEGGVARVNGGDLAGGLLILDAVIRDLAAAPNVHAKDLSRGYLYRGIALVGLGQEEDAKGSFASALRYDKMLRVSEDQFPPRVVRVFEAARLGKTKSVLVRPSSASKRLFWAALAAGAAAGGISVAGGKSAPTFTPPSPAPTATESFSGTLNELTFTNRSYEVTVQATGTLTATLQWALSAQSSPATTYTMFLNEEQSGAVVAACNPTTPNSCELEAQVKVEKYAIVIFAAPGTPVCNCDDGYSLVVTRPI